MPSTQFHRQTAAARCGGVWAIEKQVEEAGAEVQEPGPEGQPPPEDCLPCHAEGAGGWPQPGKRPPPRIQEVWPSALQS